MSGYQSDINLQDITFVGDFPIEHSIGGYGETTGATDDYALVLDPPISQYRVGMHLQVKFNHANGGTGTLDVDGKGAVPLMKIVNGALADLDPNDLNDTLIYDLIFDGICFQIVTGIKPQIPAASEGEAGIAEIASQPEVDAGIENSKIVTPQTLFQFVSDKITGLWENKGFFDCSTNPNYPVGQAGDAYTVSIGGKIGGAAGEDVEPRDVFYCINDNPGGDQATVGADWGIIQSNLVQATEIIAGIAEIATQAEVNAGADDLRIVTALKLKNLLDGRNATEVQTGLAEIATQAEVNTGGDNSRIVTPLKLATWFVTKLATEGAAGIAEIATQVETDAGADNQRIVTPLKLKVRLDNYLNRETQLSIAGADINPNIRTTPGRNRYVSMNGNLIICKDIRLKPNIAIPATYNFVHILNFPKPLNTPTPHQPTIMLSSTGNVYFVQVDANGKVFLSGTFTGANEELILNLTPYVAKFPLEYNGAQPPS